MASSRPPHRLLELATGYQQAKVLFTFVELGIGTLLSRRALPFEELVDALGLERLAADRFLNACVSVGLLERIDASYRNTAIAERFLDANKSAYLGDFIARYDAISYPLWTDLSRRLREWEPGATDDTMPPEDDQGAAALEAQHNLSRLVGATLAEAYDFSQHEELLDLGGGTGAVTISICEAYPELRATLLDLPNLIPIAERYVADAGLADRIALSAGNFKEDDLTAGFDVVLLANLLSVSSEETNRRLFEELFRLLPSGGAVVISGWILDDSRTSPLLPVLFCLEDIIWHAPDVERTVSTYERWLRDAGFVEVEHSEYAPPWSMLVARKRA